jgi:hypothetical protein
MKSKDLTQIYDSKQVVISKLERIKSELEKLKS